MLFLLFFRLLLNQLGCLLKKLQFHGRKICTVLLKMH